VAAASGRLGTMDDIRSLGVLGRAWAGGIVAFSIARALIAWPTLGRYGVNPWTFLVLDIVTALPYGIGQALTVKILRDRDRAPREALPWALVVAAAFLAPYIYIFSASGSMPLLAYLGVLAWMAVFGVLAVIRMSRQVRTPLDVPVGGLVHPASAAVESTAPPTESPDSPRRT
jgi:hypothetical protein